MSEKKNIQSYLKESEKLEQHKDKLNRLKKKIKAKDKYVKDIRLQTEEKERKINELKQLIREKGILKTKKEGELKKIKSDLKKLEQEKKNLQKELEQIEKQVKKMQAELKKIESEILTHEKEKKKIEDKKKVNQKKVNALKNTETKIAKDKKRIVGLLKVNGLKKTRTDRLINEEKETLKTLKDKSETLDKSKEDLKIANQKLVRDKNVKTRTIQNQETLKRQYNSQKSQKESQQRTKETQATRLRQRIDVLEDNWKNTKDIIVHKSKRTGLFGWGGRKRWTETISRQNERNAIKADQNKLVRRLQELQSSINEIKQAIIRIVNLIRQCSATIFTNRNESQQINEEIRDNNGTIQRLDEQQMVVNNDITLSQNELNQQRENYRVLEEEEIYLVGDKEERVEQLNKLSEDIRDTQNVISTCDSNIQSLTTTLSAKRIDFTKKEKELSDKNGEMDKKSVEIMKKEENKQNKVNDITVLKDDIKTTQENMENTEIEKKEIEKQQLQLIDEVIDLKKQKKKVQSNIKTCESKINKMGNTKDLLEEKYNENSKKFDNSSGWEEFEYESDSA